VPRGPGGRAIDGEEGQAVGLPPTSSNNVPIICSVVPYVGLSRSEGKDQSNLGKPSQ
jgi:hypothetical protein